MSSVLETLTIHELTKRRNDLLKQIEKIDKIIKKYNTELSPEEIISTYEVEHVDNILCIDESNTNIKSIHSETIQSQITQSETKQPKTIKINIKKITKNENGDIKKIVEVEKREDLSKVVIKRIKIKK